jgi:hypothetical protein
MKKIVLFAILSGLFVCSIAFAQKKKTTNATPKATDTTTASTKDTLLPYQKNPKFPSFKMLLMDSTTMFNTSTLAEGKPILLFYFGAECDHCFRMVEKLLPGMDSLSNVQIVMATFSNPTPIRAFYERFHLSKYKNITLGKDNDFFLGPFYGARSVPCLVMYDKHKKLVRKWEDAASIHDLTATELYNAANSK